MVAGALTENNLPSTEGLEEILDHLTLSQALAGLAV